MVVQNGQQPGANSRTVASRTTRPSDDEVRARLAKRFEAYQTLVDKQTQQLAAKDALIAELNRKLQAAVDRAETYRQVAEQQAGLLDQLAIEREQLAARYARRLAELEDECNRVRDEHDRAVRELAAAVARTEWLWNELDHQERPWWRIWRRREREAIGERRWDIPAGRGQAL